jgi:hypothetical protein
MVVVGTKKMLDENNNINIKTAANIFTMTSTTMTIITIYEGQNIKASMELAKTRNCDDLCLAVCVSLHVVHV